MLSIDENAFSFYSFAGLIELAVSAGYVNLGSWVDLNPFTEALVRFEEREGSSDNATDLTLVRTLKLRLDQKNYRVAKLDEKLFYAFASYLHLTREIYSDWSVQHFITGTVVWIDRQSSNSDLSFLLSPHLFAEALATGTVAGISRPAAKLGLKALLYFERFTDILRRIDHDRAFQRDLIRHARWSHLLLRVSKRLDVWDERMVQWDELATGRIEEHFPSEGGRLLLLRPTQRDLEDLGLPKRPQLPSTESVQPEYSTAVVMAETDKFLAEGRTGAARIRLKSEAEAISRRLVSLSVAGPEAERQTPEWQRLATALISVCTKLATLGSVKVAAVILAPYIGNLVNRFGPNDATTKRALNIMSSFREQINNANVAESIEQQLPFRNFQEGGY
ncbi:hypothetical protein IVA86_28380 [Bradyrhizobium sp. 146]|uniref:hypothetical protein n=1 Tax=Bradyrhizobium sp. 146 TaxID=2782622 RepID=UPI001FFC03CB|nr:hypothetical protein [Bradyrhizobium sp. 146]MCK1705217.1 hypothetical protein [Bradyrhizobium sp. 146]